MGAAGGFEITRNPLWSPAAGAPANAAGAPLGGAVAAAAQSEQTSASAEALERLQQGREESSARDSAFAVEQPPQRNEQHPQPPALAFSEHTASRITPDDFDLECGGGGAAYRAAKTSKKRASSKVAPEAAAHRADSWGLSVGGSVASAGGGGSERPLSSGGREEGPHCRPPADLGPERAPQVPPQQPSGHLVPPRHGGRGWRRRRRRGGRLLLAGAAAAGCNLHAAPRQFLDRTLFQCREVAHDTRAEVSRVMLAIVFAGGMFVCAALWIHLFILVAASDANTNWCGCEGDRKSVV